MKTIFLVLSFLFISTANIYAMNQGNKDKSSKTETITLGAGCFWCVEALFEELKGVIEVESGYMGGQTKNPSYEEICTGFTGHAEVCKITYDAKIISFDELLEVFWQVHNPTTLNRQGNDVGTQYRSVIFYSSEDQKNIAQEYIKELNKLSVWNDSIVTEISAESIFYKAEKYHQDYYNNNKNQPYCTMVIKPKQEKFKKLFKDKLK